MQLNPSLYLYFYQDFSTKKLKLTYLAAFFSPSLHIFHFRWFKISFSVVVLAWIFVFPSVSFYSLEGTPAGTPGSPAEQGLWLHLQSAPWCSQQYCSRPNEAGLSNNFCPSTDQVSLIL